MKPRIYLLTLDITLDGGVERVVCNMSDYFCKQGYETTIFSIFQQNNSLSYQFNSDINYFYIFPHLSYSEWLQQNKWAKGQLFKRYLISLLLTQRIYRYINHTTKPDEKKVILCNDYLHTPFYKNNNVKIFGVDHSRYPFGSSRGFKHFLRTFYVHHSLDIVTTLNHEEVPKWESLGRPVIVMPNFLPSRFVAEYNYIHRENVILSMGRMNTEQKGFDRLIEAYSIIASKYPNWKLKIFGSGKYQQKYKDMVNKLNLQNNIQIKDFTSDPLKEYQEASIYAMCSREEGFPMVLLEAGKSGLPIVAYDIEFGPHTIISEGNTGFIVTNNNKYAFVKKLELLMSDNALREKMSNAIKNDIMVRFSEAVIMEKWEKLINEI